MLQATAPPHCKRPVEASWASLSDASWTRPQGRPWTMTLSRPGRILGSPQQN